MHLNYGYIVMVKLTQLHVQTVKIYSICKNINKSNITSSDSTLLRNINGNFFQTLNVLYRVNNRNKEIQPLRLKNRQHN